MSKIRLPSKHYLYFLQNKFPMPHITARTHWIGKETYKGTTPCLKPCKGIMTEITIRQDSTYSLNVLALGQEETPRKFEGTFYWDKTKNVITLDANGDHHKFKVQEGSLKELDKFGDPKQLGKQEDYILKKQ
jgi:uncharacterized lipoprotein NlpE involved in copper resistance